MKIMMSRALLAALLSGSALTMSAVSAPAAAQVGGIVHDPRNYAQNILTAARTLEQINNQIKQLQNQAASLANEARNLTSLPVSALQEMQGQVDRTRQLLGEAQRVAFESGGHHRSEQQAGVVGEILARFEPRGSRGGQ